MKGEELKEKKLGYLGEDSDFVLNKKNPMPNDIGKKENQQPSRVMGYGRCHAVHRI